MPKQTFFNLPAEKRERLIERALVEFASHSYSDASLSGILADVGIAKGSLYQYFDGKLDLYRWLLLDEVPRRKRAAVAEHAANPSLTLRERLVALVLGGAELMLREPALHGVARSVGHPTSDPSLRAVHREARALGRDEMRAYLERAQEQGELRGDLDLDLFTQVLGLVLGQGLPTLVGQALGVELDDLLREPERTRRRSRVKLRAIVDATVDLLLQGATERRPAMLQRRRRTAAG